MSINPSPSGAPKTPDALHAFLLSHLDLKVSRTPLLSDSSAPFDYLCHTFFEGRRFDARGELVKAAAAEEVEPDAIVWAARGGGKTLLAAVATLLDLLFKPGIEIHMLAGSVEQGRRLYQHLRELLERPAMAEFIDGKITARGVKLINGSHAELLAQSETSVRGCRVQKLRCDEIELFDREVWNAAQLITRSMPLPGPWGKEVRGSIDALSTMHRPFGLMWELVGHFGAPGGGAGGGGKEEGRGETGTDGESDGAASSAAAALSADPAALMEVRRRRVFKWGVLDVLEHCQWYRACAQCSLHEECQGRAKKRDATEAGHFGINDALLLKSRVSLPVWQTEMLCARPSRTDSVYPEFSEDRHVVSGEPVARRPPGIGTLLMGMDFGFRSPAVMLLATHDDDDVLCVLEERVASGCTVQEHIDAVRVLGWPMPKWIGIDPAGLQVSDQTARNARQVLTAAGYTVKTRPSNIHDGVMLVRARLAPADESRPRLLISRRCPKLIKALTSYHYDLEREWSLEPVKDGPDHAADALRYMILNLDRPGAKMSSYAGGR